MKVKFIVPEYVGKNVKLNSDKNNCFLTGTEFIGIDKKPWCFYLPTGTWSIFEQDFIKGEIILWNRLNEIQDEFEYISEKFSIEKDDLIEYLNLCGKKGLEVITIKSSEQETKYDILFKRKII